MHGNKSSSVISPHPRRSLSWVGRRIFLLGMRASRTRGTQGNLSEDIGAWKMYKGMSRVHRSCERTASVSLIVKQNGKAHFLCSSEQGIVGLCFGLLRCCFLVLSLSCPDLTVGSGRSGWGRSICAVDQTDSRENCKTYIQVREPLKVAFARGLIAEPL